MIAPETLDLERIRLRRPRLTDADAIFEYASDPDVVRYMDWPRCMDEGQIVDALHARAAAWDTGAEFYWVITLPNDDRAIGSVSCQVVRHAAEFGYLLHKKHWGKGFATVGSKAIADWALSNSSICRIWATCDIDNLASARVLEKAEFSREGVLRRAIVRPNISGEARDALIYSRVRLAA